MSNSTEGINKLIPVPEASRIRQLPAEGERSVMVPGPGTEEVAISRDHGRLSKLNTYNSLSGRSGYGVGKITLMGGYIGVQSTKLLQVTYFISYGTLISYLAFLNSRSPDGNLPGSPDFWLPSPYCPGR